MPLIISDDFYEHAREHGLPDCAVSFLIRAGSWSARNSRSGYVPASMLADFSSDPALVKRTLLAAGFIERAKKSGVRIAEGHGITVINAADAAEQADRKRQQAAERQRRHRAAKAAERQERIASGVTPTSRGTCDSNADVTRGEPGKPVKPQARGTPVTRDISVTSRVTDRSDLDQSSIRVKSKSDARVRDDSELVTAVADAICAKVGFVPSDDQVRSVIAVIRERARKAGTRIRSPLAYIPGAVAKESDLWDGLLLPSPPPRPPDPDPAWNPPVTGWDPDCHEYDPPVRGAPCRCGYTQSSPRHHPARTA